MIKKNNIFLLFISMVLLLTLNNCKKDKAPTSNGKTMPHAYVNFWIDLTSISYSALNNIGGYVTVSGGVNGILIYRSSNDEYMAFDRQCTLLSDSCVQLTVDKSGLYIVDTKCKSKFIILDGAPDPKSPSQIPLLRYQTSNDGVNLHVYN
jgi:hypothetical protein